MVLLSRVFLKQFRRELVMQQPLATPDRLVSGAKVLLATPAIGMLTEIVPMVVNRVVVTEFAITEKHPVLVVVTAGVHQERLERLGLLVPTVAGHIV
jgi:hypothetical protein